MIGVVMAAGQVAENPLSAVISSFVAVIVVLGAIRILVEIVRPVRRSRRRCRRRKGDLKVNFPILFPNENAEIAVSVGEKGEAMVRDVIEDLPSDRYVVLHDVWLPMETGGETQIDHVIVSPFGIFVIETKNWKGMIYADEKSPVWTKYNCGYKDTYKNPIRQNYKHIVSIREKFFRVEREFVFGVVAMSPEADFKYGVPKGVVYYDELGSWIMGYVTPCIKQEQIPEIVSAIQEWSSTVSEDARRRHCGK